VWLAIIIAGFTTPLASAATVNVMVLVDDAGVVPLDAVILPGDPAALSSSDGPIEVIDAHGVPLAWGGFHNPRHRSVIYPEGGGASVELARGIITARVAWPPGAERLFVGGVEVVPRVQPQWRDAHNAEQVAVTGDASQRLDLIFLSDGYTADQQVDFDADVDDVVDYLLQLDPYSRYAGFFNIWKTFTPSDRSGVHDLGPNPHDETALGCYYGCLSTERLICCDDEEVVHTASDALPDYDGIMVLVNDTHYGGSGSSSYATAYVGSEGVTVATHELGHALVALWDEYTYPGTTGHIDFAPNCTSNSAFPHWSAWLDEDEIDTFQGCSYTDAYRPTANQCLMRTLGHPDYCPVCREWIVHSVYAMLPSRLIESVTPDPDAQIRLRAGESQEFLVDILGPDDVVLQWSSGDEILDETTVDEPFFLDGCSGVNGELTLTALDPTDWVRDDPYGHTWHSETWPVSTQRCGACGCAAPLTPPTGGLVVLWSLLLISRRRR